MNQRQLIFEVIKYLNFRIFESTNEFEMYELANLILCLQKEFEIHDIEINEFLYGKPIHGKDKLFKLFE